MRCFLALELPERALRSLESAAALIRAKEPLWAGEKWTSAGTMHVTLKFLGELPEDTAGKLLSEYRAALPDVRPFPLTSAGLRAVPSAGRATMIWSRIEDPTGRCASLARLADRIAEGHGVPVEGRRFTPHVTLVRARRPRRIDAETLVEAAHASGLDGLGAMSVLSASLFSSTLTPHGPIHERLAEFVLGTGEGR